MNMNIFDELPNETLQLIVRHLISCPYGKDWMRYADAKDVQYIRFFNGTIH